MNTLQVLAGITVAGVLAGCSSGPPDRSTGPIAPRVARLDDTAGISLPAPASGDYCMAAQQILASTTLTGSNTVFTDMPEYRHSKPSADPHRIYQVVTYAGAMPIVVSCKTKTAAHLRAVYGPEAAGEQLFCPELANRAQRQAVAELADAGQPEAAARATAFVVDANEPYSTGQAYLEDFELSYRAADGTVHLNSPGLFQDYDSWITRFLPWQVRGQAYCHVATVDYIKALATGEIEPGTVITTGENATVTPR
ncbi:MAG: hypothetical protein JNK40_11360 [Chromatiales bacterium]|nr:hypothetical protein [Chromatiales bacterium]